MLSWENGWRKIGLVRARASGLGGCSCRDHFDFEGAVFLARMVDEIVLYGPYVFSL